MPKFVTVSSLYGWDAPEAQIRTTRKNCALFATVSLVLSIVSGILPTGVTRSNWVGFAGTAALVAVMLEIIAVVRFITAKSQLDYRSFHSIHWMMDYAPLLHAMLMSVALVAGIVSCVQNYTGGMDLLILFLYILAAAASLLMRRTYRTLPVYTLKEQET